MQLEQTKWVDMLTWSLPFIINLILWCLILLCEFPFSSSVRFEFSSYRIYENVIRDPKGSRFGVVKATLERARVNVANEYLLSRQMLSHENAWTKSLIYSGRCVADMFDSSTDSNSNGSSGRLGHLVTGGFWRALSMSNKSVCAESSS